MSPSWDALYEFAEAQQGCFTRQQAQEAGFSDQLLQNHLKGGAVERLHRGIYRLVRFPSAGREQEDLVVAWLWSSTAGVLSHETALRLHGLSDALPSRIHLTVPAPWAERKLTPPQGVHLYFAEIGAGDRTFVGVVPVTTAARSINDVAAAHGDVQIVEAAVRQAIQRGLAAPADVLPAIEWLATLRTGASLVRPQAVADLDGSWLMEVVSGVCRVAPAPDWRTDAEDFAHTLAARLHAARYFPGSRTMRLEFVWPSADRESRPASADIRTKAVRHFGWMA